MNKLESLTKESDSLVVEVNSLFLVLSFFKHPFGFPSSMEHVKFRENPQGPPCKAKYS